MPQLMPLNWMFSVIIIAFIFLSMNFIYGENSKKKTFVQINFIKKDNLMWYW
uniref:ATP synthase F0 subunit 8 n=1 Tax=Hypsosinga pygmaea TaxID=336661 RepID=A0A0U2I6F5_9ARAC|nr:ATP synthase F0 subunit 8 [Hypsosinga pygmaea]ALF36390.1 ATP synthase F0 subunit 8 [Hypsosinga pygmaea]